MTGPDGVHLPSDEHAERAAVDHMIREWAEVARAIALRRRRR